MSFGQNSAPSQNQSVELTDQRTESARERQSALNQSRLDLTTLEEEVNRDLGADDLELLESAGISSDLFAEDDVFQGANNEVGQAGLDQQITKRFQELVGTQTVTESLSALRDEFGEQMDEKSLSVLADFESLLSPTVIADNEEREAVETLLVTSFDGSFTRESFTNFVEDIYQQDNSVISEATKDAIEKQFRIPQSEIHTGDQLTQRVMMTDDSGNPIFNSKENAVEFRAGLKAYAGENGRVKLAIDGNSRVNALEIPLADIEDSEKVAQYANYAAIRQLMYEELDELTNLFGDGQEATTAAPSEKMILDSKRFLDAVLERREPGNLLNREELDDLRMTLKAMNPTPAVTEAGAKQALEEIGVIRDGSFQWDTMDQIGGILRANNYLRAFEHRSAGLAHDKLKIALSAQSELSSSSYDKNTKDELMPAYNQKRTLYAYLEFSGFVKVQFLLRIIASINATKYSIDFFEKLPILSYLRT